MMVPRSYQHVMALTDRHSLPLESSRGAGRSRKPRHTQDSPEHTPHGKPKQLCVAPAATLSKPVVIPIRPAPPKPRRDPSSSSEKDDSSSLHDPNTVPPSMAALLAITSLQNSRGLAIRRNTSWREIAGASFSPDDFRHVLSTSSPKSWNILQSPPEGVMDTSQDSEVDGWSLTSDSTIAASSPERSLSNDSIPSLDMELDFDSPGLASPTTPTTRARIRSRREKLPSPKTPVHPGTSHPLSRRAGEEDIALLPLTPSKGSDTIATSPTIRGTPPTSPFRSNLTTSIRRLKTAARTLTTTPSKPDTRSLPKSSYDSLLGRDPFEPPQIRANIDALPFHLRLASPLPALPPTASIQLMPYIPSSRPTSASATAPPVFLPAENPPADLMDEQKTSQRPREPRENSDFLRVVVMEMNMRRAGKLDGEGRARLWLGPRNDGQENRTEEQRDVIEGVVGAMEDIEGEVLKANGELDPLGPRSSEGLAKERTVPRRWISVPA